MLDVPKYLSDSTFDDILTKGAIILTRFLCHDGISRPHFHIILNYNNADENLLYIISTSQLDFYNKNPKFNSDIVRIPAGEVNCLLKESIIDCRQIFSVKKELFKQRYSDNALEFVGNIPTDILQCIDNTVEQSRFISPNVKGKILGPKLNKE